MNRRECSGTELLGRNADEEVGSMEGQWMEHGCSGYTNDSRIHVRVCVCVTGEEQKTSRMYQTIYGRVPSPCASSRLELRAHGDDAEP